MKKAIVLLLVLFLLGSFVFAEDAKAAKKPEITYGTTATFKSGLIPTSFTAPTEDGLELENDALVGYRYAKGQLFKVEPWVKAAWGNFFLKGTVGYKASRRNIGGNEEPTLEEDKLFSLDSGYSYEGLSITNTLKYDVNNYGDSTASTPALKYFANDFYVTVEQDNLSAGLALSSTLTPKTSVYEQVLDIVDTAEVIDWHFGINDIFGFVDVGVGGTDEQMSYDFRKLGFYPSITAANLTSTAGTDFGLWFSGYVLGNVPVYTKYDIAKLVEAIPLTIETGIIVPDMKWQEKTKLSEYFSTEGISFALGYTLPEIFGVKLGFDSLLFGKDRLTYNSDDLVFEMAGAPTDDSNFFLDADVLLVPNLTARASLDIAFGKTKSEIPADTTGAGTQADPYEYKFINKTIAQFGAEAVYNFADTLPLKLYGGIYGAFVSGADYEEITGSAYAKPNSDIFYVADNLTEANLKKGMLISGDPDPLELETIPFTIALRGAYTFDNKDSAYLESVFKNKVGFLKKDFGLGKTPFGFYSTEAITANYTKVVGKGKLALDAAYTMYFGIPTVGNLKIEDDNDKVSYKAWVAKTYSPLSFALTYTATF